MSFPNNPNSCLHEILRISVELNLDFFSWKPIFDLGFQTIDGQNLKYLPPNFGIWLYEFQRPLVTSRTPKIFVLIMFRLIIIIGPKIAKIWAWLHCEHWWVVGVLHDSLKRSVTAPSLLSRKQDTQNYGIILSDFSKVPFPDT